MRRTIRVQEVEKTATQHWKAGRPACFWLWTWISLGYSNGTEACAFQRGPVFDELCRLERAWRTTNE